MRGFREWADDRAGDLGATVARRLVDIVVGTGVDHHRRSVSIEQLRHPGVRQDHRRVDAAIGVDCDVGHVAGMRAVGIVETMLLVGRVPVRPGT